MLVGRTVLRENVSCRATKLCTVALPNICGFSVSNLLHVTILAPRVLRGLLDFWKVCATLGGGARGSAVG